MVLLGAGEHEGVRNVTVDDDTLVIVDNAELAVAS
jgi:hypothetical protein